MTELRSNAPIARWMLTFIASLRQSRFAGEGQRGFYVHKQLVYGEKT